SKSRPVRTVFFGRVSRRPPCGTDDSSRQALWPDRRIRKPRESLCTRNRLIPVLIRGTCRTCRGKSSRSTLALSSCNTCAHAQNNRHQHHSVNQYLLSHCSYLRSVGRAFAATASQITRLR